jgi:hypothetical protein
METAGNTVSEIVPLNRAKTLEFHPLIDVKTFEDLWASPRTVETSP